MQTKTVRTPFAINAIFLLLISIGAIGLLLSYQSTHASSLDKYCSRQFDQSMRYKISPLAQKKCESRFKIITDQWTTGNFTSINK